MSIHIVQLSALQVGLRGSLMIAAVLVLRACFRRKLPQRLFPALWLLCGLRLVIPLSAAVSVGAKNAGAWCSSLASAPLVAGGWLAGPAVSAETTTERAAASIATTLAEASDFPGEIAWLAQLVWLAGTVLLAAAFISTYIRWRRRFCASLPFTAPLPFIEILSAGTASPPELRVSDQITSPLSFGLWHPVILLPKGLDRSDTETIQYIFMHESVHLRRRDNIKKAFFAAVLCLYWYCPPVWLMYGLANQDLEISCDEAVLHAAGEDRKAEYARALLRVEEARHGGLPLYSHFSGSGMEKRIGEIMNIKKKSALAAVATLLLILSVTTVFAAQVQVGAEAGTCRELPSETEFTLLWPAATDLSVTCPFGTTDSGVFVDHITIGSTKGSAQGSEISAAADGFVCEVGWDSQQGNYLQIDHANGWRTRYTHCKEIQVAQGDAVACGQRIGTVGATGMATGPCLGFYLFREAEACDPELYLRSSAE